MSARICTITASWFETAGEGDGFDRGTTKEASQAEKSEGSRSAGIYCLRIEYIPEDACGNAVGDGESLKGWFRELEISGRNTLEQLSEVILHLLGWDASHLYEFRIRGRIYAHLTFLHEDELFVDSRDPCVSCHVPIRRLGLAVSDTFTYLYDYGDHHVFRMTVLGIRHDTGRQFAPRLSGYAGENIVQYPGTLTRMDAQTFKRQKPAVRPPDPQRFPWRIRFVRDIDKSTLEQWRASNDRNRWQKAVTILENRKLSPETIAEKIERPVSHVHKWITAFNRHGMEGLTQVRGRRKREEGKKAPDQRARRILEIVHAKPSAYGINRSSWNLISIARTYEKLHQAPVGRSTVSTVLRKFGYGIRKARKVLTSPDPNYREKVEVLLHTLQNLHPGELFFFVDELGPLRVKKYGGRALVRKGEALTYPQEQAHRGVIVMSGALSATTNQVTWLYGKAKDTSAMIDLIEVLYNQYFAATHLYVTWDAASWHRSGALVEWLDTFNAETQKRSEGPVIRLVPLPTSSQFLDVIEAVFSGMKRAVVHHSDYANEREMKQAISAHFVERNAHFIENPRRAGKQIWEVDFFDDHKNILSGNYREW